MKTMSVEEEPMVKARSLEGALRNAGVSEVVLAKRQVETAISIANTAFDGLLKSAPHAMRITFAVETILCKGRVVGLSGGSPARQWELKEELCIAGIPMEDVLTVEDKITKALGRRR
ncbi:MAG: hypothetical protein A3I33_00875 [Candidatus Colwellbacteria bacterium RIFCSPLOWO2_02_FULL_45_11]|uniref:Uncharacterized protein n=1 Tax=Candidatus Colwellbacteria bacterium RIFCSPLOWO2_02_FULL_45_11 TaxID=1797692 RepID=A0A1G1ZCL5_9BACT|nr:MAG: hypothetical protein A3I33_00875 [Candidatus Colwellbacteria bacterium RIFCSPLOWO2_02_FULL_45_11]